MVFYSIWYTNIGHNREKQLLVISRSTNIPSILWMDPSLVLESSALCFYLPDSSAEPIAGLSCYSLDVDTLQHLLMDLEEHCVALDVFREFCKSQLSLVPSFLL